MYPNLCVLPIHSLAMPNFIEGGISTPSYLPWLVLAICFAVAYTFLYIYIYFCSSGDLPGGSGTQEAIPIPNPGSLEDVVPVPDPGSLPTTEYIVADEGDNAECSICLGEFMEGDTVKVLPHCRHMYHSVCIDEWLYGHLECPLCRLPVWEDPHVV